MKRYSLISRTIHWLTAGLIVSQYCLAELAEQADHNNEVVKQIGLLANHKSIGMTILMLAIVRLGWRFFNKPPALPTSMPSWQLKASAVSHWSLYFLIFAVPLSGWLMSSATAYSVSWFNLFAFPDLVSANESLASQMHGLHELFAELLFVIALIHIVAAVKHHWIDKDDVLARMAGLSGWSILILSLLIAIGIFGRVSPDTNTNSSNPDSNNSNSIKALSKSDLSAWQIDYSDSYIKFSGDQAGAPFEGQWQKWTAKIQFDANQLNKSRFDVIIDSNSPFSNDSERDGYIIGSDFFNAAVFSESRFVADQFSQTKQGPIASYQANGELKMKDVVHPLTLDFQIEKGEGTIILSGSAIIDRLKWNIGVGDWSDTSWVGQNIQVSVRVVATNE